MLADLGWQASTLGGRQVDAILDGKASFRGGAQGVGEVGMLGAQAAISSGDGGAAGALAVVGVAAVLISAAVKAMISPRVRSRIGSVSATTPPRISDDPATRPQKSASVTRGSSLAARSRGNHPIRMMSGVAPVETLSPVRSTD